MNKINLIIKREYLTRVKKKSFIIMTFLTPLLFAALVIVPVVLTQTMKDETVKIIAVSDNTGLYNDVLKDKDFIVFKTVDDEFSVLKKEFGKRGYYAVLEIKDNLINDPNAISLYSKKQVNLDIQNMISRQLRDQIRETKKASYNVENIDEILKDLNTKINITSIKWGKDGKARESSVEIAMVLGVISAFVIYMFIFMYGVQVMRGVIEEKTSRIVEVIVSSVKPFQLMMGKVIGLALVGLTQFVLWVVLSSLLITVAQATFMPDMPTNQAPGMEMVNAAQASQNGGSAEFAKIINSLNAINIPEVLGFFLIYFLGGYLLYAAMFAAIGSAVDNETDTQQFMLPVTIPMVFAIYVAMSAINNPHGPLAFWCSLFPLTSPVVMMVRIPFEVPLWERLLSVGLLIVSFIGMTWLASRIYRTGILMYGKKVNYKEIFKWLKYKG